MTMFSMVVVRRRMSPSWGVLGRMGVSFDNGFLAVVLSLRIKIHEFFFFSDYTSGSSTVRRERSSEGIPDFKNLNTDKVLKSAGVRMTIDPS